MQAKSKEDLERNLDKAIHIFKTASAESVELVGVNTTVLMLNQIVKTLTENKAYIEGGEK